MNYPLNRCIIKLIIHILTGFCIGISSYHVNAQSPRLDSAISLLQAGHKQGKVDTVLLNKIRPLIRSNEMTEPAVQRIVGEANRYKTGDNEDMNFSICYQVLQALSNRDRDGNRDTAIYFGKILLQRIEKSKSPEKNFYIYSILGYLRSPYRNSRHLAAGIQLYNNYLVRFRELNDSTGMATCHFVLGGFYRAIGLFDRGIYYIKKSMAYLDSSKQTGKTYFGGRKPEGRSVWINNMGVLPEYYNLNGDAEEGIKYARLYLELTKKNNNNATYAIARQRLAESYLQANRQDSALYFVQQAYDLCDSAAQWVLPSIFQNWSLLELSKGNYRKADSLLVKCEEVVRRINLSAYSAAGVTNPDYYRALVYVAQKKYAEAAGFLLSDIVRVRNLRNELLMDYKLLGEVYDKLGDAEKSKQYYKAFISLQDSLLNDQRKYSAISFEAEQQMNEKEVSISQLKNKNKISTLTRNFSFGIIALVVLLAGLIYYRYRTKQKANLVLEKTLSHLKSTQQQLIHSEKMASLGELTAGIAHEIQNPLNFVNNFSEVNQELIGEMNDQLDAGNMDDARHLGKDIKENEEKISHHGKRADAIVKNMLLHSSAGSGKKEQIDLNALADEYLRLAFHGLRSRDKSFNAKLETAFDKGLKKVEVIPQDIGRVLLNLINNALFAVDEKRKSGPGNYEPAVKVSSALRDNKVMISISDNGNGISDTIKGKIFQPFFTTKATGQGTGLGLSLSYDIIKAHGGEIILETKEGEGSTFTVKLPV